MYGRAQAQLTGTVTIPSANYPTLKSAVDSLNAQGVGTGGVVINLTAGNPQTAPAGGYQLGSTVLNASTSATKTITINGNANVVTAQVGTSTTVDGIFFIKGTDYVTIDALNLTESAANTTATTAMEYGYGMVHLNGAAPFDGVQNNTIKNCTITLNRTIATPSIGIYMGHTLVTSNTALTITAAADANSNNKFYGNNISNVVTGIQMIGFSDVTPFALYDRNNDVGGNSAATGNTITNFGTGYTSIGGITAANQDSTNVSYNIINDTANGGVAVVGGIWGIYTFGTNSTFNIKNNDVVLRSASINTSYFVYGIYANAAGTNMTAQNNKVNVGQASGSAVPLYGMFFPNGNNLIATNNDITDVEGVNGVVNGIYTTYVGNVNISSNTMQYSTTAAVTGTYNCIYNGATSVSATINNNKFNNITANTTGTAYLIYNNTATPSCTINNNAVVTQFTRSGNSSNVFYGIYNNGSPTGTTVISGNNFSNVTINGSGGGYGIYYNTNTGVTQTAVNDTITNWTSTGTGSIYGIYMTYGLLSTVDSNFVSGLSGAGTVYGIYVGNTSTIASATFANKVTNLSTSGTSSSIYGIYLGGTTTTTQNAYLNNVNGIAASGSGATAYGVYVSSGSTTNIYNNFVSGLNTSTSSGTSPVYGMYFSAGATINAYYNTINLTPTSTGTNFGATGIYYAAGVGTLDLRNNIVRVMATAAGTGTVVALRRSTGTAGTAPSNLALTSNANIYHVPTAANHYFYNESTSTTAVNGFNITNDAAFNSSCGAYKKFMAPRETATFNENNLTQIGTTPTFAPTGTSYAEGGAVATSAPSVTTDFNGAARGTTPDIGALQFAGTAVSGDVAAPSILYTALPVTTYCTTPPTLTATITDASGVNNTAGTKPRLYYKKSTENNAFGGGNTSAVNGWKYVEGSNSGSTYTFVFDYSILNTAIANGDSITYFVVAQDNAATPNVGSNIVGFASGYCPASVNILAAGGPITATPKPNGYKILALPTFTAAASPASLCNSGTTTLTLSPALVGDATLQWQQDNGTGTFVNIGSATTNPYTTANQTANNNFKAVVSCGVTPIATSSTAALTVATPTVTGTTPGSRCGFGTVTLGATGSAGTTLNWYAASTGGTSLGTGNSFTTPAIGGTTSFYVESSVTSIGSATVGATYSGSTNNGTSVGSHGIRITTTQPNLNIVSANIPFTGTGTITVQLQNDATGAMIATATSPTLTGGGTTPVTVPLGINVAAAGTYRLVISSISGSVGGLGYISSGTYPYTDPSGAFSVISGYWYATDPGNMYLFNLVVSGVSSKCAAPRTAVAATVTPAPAITASSPQAPGICTGGSATISVTSANAGYAYSWSTGQTTASFTVSPTAGTTYVVTATDAVTSCVAKDSVTINVNAVPSVATLTPTSGTICQGSSLLLSATNGAAATGTLGTAASTSTATTTGAALGPNPFQDYYGGTKQQMMFRASELSALGLLAGYKITGLSINLPAATTTANFFQNLTIKAGTSPLTDMSTSWATGLSTVRAAANYTATTGVNTFTFSSPITWDGVNNVVVEFAYTNNNGGTTGVTTASFYTTPFVSTRFYRVDNTTSATLDAFTGTPSFTYSSRNNTVLNYLSSAPISWTPVTGLYRNAGLTVPILANDTAGSVYASPATTTTYNAVSNAQGCRSANSNNSVVTVNPAPPTTITYTGATTFCQGNPLTLNAPTGTGLTYQWNRGGTPITGATSVTYAADTTGAYTVTVTNATPCTFTTVTPVNLTVNPTPSAAITASGSTTFCTGGSVVLSAPVAPAGRVYKYVWKDNNVAVTPAQTGQTFTVNTSRNVTVTVTDSVTGCNATTPTATVVTSGAPPVAPISGATSTTICQGQTVRLRTNKAAGLTYQWYLGGSPIPGAIDSVYNAGTAGSYTVDVSITGATGCLTTSSPITVSVNALPPATITASGAPTTFCSGGSVTLTGNTGTNLAYQWQNGAGPATAPNTASTYTATAGGTYTLIVTNTTTQCFNTSNAIPVTVNPLPTATITAASATSICQGASVVLNANSGAGLSYQWFNGAGPITGATSASYTANTAGSYTVKVTNANTCSATSAATTVTVNPLPPTTVTPTGPVNICSGSSITLNGPTTPTGLTYQWKNGVTNATGTSTTASYTTSAAGNYRLVVTTASGCKDSSAVTAVSVVPLPAAAMTPAAPAAGCDSVVLSTANTAVTYQWNYNGAPILGANSATYAARVSGNYSLTNTSTANGCSATTSNVAITVNQSPIGQITYSSPLIFCQGGAVVLNTYTGANQTYEWRNSNVAIPGATGSSYITTQSGVYTVQVVNTATTCTRVSQAVIVQVNPLPTPQIVYNSLSNTLSTTIPYAAYQWYLNTQPILGATGATHTPASNGAYAVSVTDTNGCVNLSSIVFVNSVGVETSPLAAQIKVYPNPATSVLYVDAPVKVKLVLRDVTGKVVLKSEDSRELDVERIADGMYLLYITTQDGRLIRAEKITKSHN